MGEFLTRQELLDLGFTSVGKDCQISSKSSFYAINGSIGDNVRIDDFCSIKGEVSFLGYNHIASYCMISGSYAPVLFKEFSFLAARCTVFAGSDNYGADTLCSAVIPSYAKAAYTSVRTGPVTLGISAGIGAHVVLLPGIVIGDGASIGAGCIVAEDIGEGEIIRSQPFYRSKRRRNVNRIRELAVRFLDNRSHPP